MMLSLDEVFPSSVVLLVIAISAGGSIIIFVFPSFCWSFCSAMVCSISVCRIFGG
jgi:hypothetical protein